MRFSTVTRTIADCLLRRSLKESYWELNKLLRSLRRLFTKQNDSFRTIIRQDYLAFVFRKKRPITSENKLRLRQAVDWILLAQDATDDDGVSLGYFPCEDDTEGWKPSYPETTGYIITSLLNYAKAFDDQNVKEAAMRMANWEIDVQMPSGAVQGGFVCPPDQQTPAAFNTGMVLDGWCSAYQESPSEPLAIAMQKAADFLVNDLGPDSYFRTNGQFVTADTIKNYNCLCAWALYRYGQIINDERYKTAAVTVIEAAIQQQQNNGWFNNNCLTRPEAPLLHTLGYTLQGILEIGILTNREGFINAVGIGIDPILKTMSKHGYLPGRFYADWVPAGLSSCLTGSAQLAIVCYRHAEHTQLDTHLAAANKITNYLKSLQLVDTPLAPANGAIAGSFPIFGSYMQGGYPNWATKYFIDALLLQRKLSRH